MFQSDEGMCSCDDNRATLPTESSTTTGQECAGMMYRCRWCRMLTHFFFPGCTFGFFNNATGSNPVVCVECPANSMSVNASDDSCMCNPGTRLLSGQGSTTVFEPCSGRPLNFI